MCSENSYIRGFVKNSLIHLHEERYLIDVVKLIERDNIKNLCIVNDNLSIIGALSKKQLNKIKKLSNDELKTKKIKDINKEYTFPIILYPNMKVFEALGLMYQFKTNCLPVVNSPWNKRIVGFLWINDIIPTLKKTV